MTETTEEKDIIAAIERCIEGDLGPAYDLSNGLHMTAKEAAAFGSWLNGELQDLEAQLSSLTKERDELKVKFEQRGRIMDGMTEDIKKLKALLSKAKEENKELKERDRVVFLDDGFDNYEFKPCEAFIKDVAENLRTAVAQGYGKNSLNEVQSIAALGAERTAYYTFDGKDCHLFWDEQEALASLKSKGEEE